MNCSPALSLFALAAGTAGQASPTWTDKEVLIAVGSVIGTLLTVGVPVVLFVLRRTAGRRLQKLRDEIIRLQRDLQHAAEGLGTAQKALDEKRIRLQQAEQAVKELRVTNTKTEDELTSERQLTAQLQADLGDLRNTLASHQTDLKGERRRIERVLRKDGQTWTEKVLSNVRDLEPLQPRPGRRTPIISVLNLKGGVGKTTITANLGAALDGLGYRVLLLDLDLQGSLTSLFLAESEQGRLHQQEQLVGDFLAASFEAVGPNLRDYIQPILPGGKSGLVATTDQLAYAEMNLTIRWLLREGRDPRFLLRRELHLKRITNQYDLILLDCPPLINVSCVNALAASDYVLVPILPSKQATARVPILLERLKAFRDNINSELNVVGILANRTHRSDLTYEEQNRLTALRGECRDTWGHDVPLFDTFIRQNAEVRVAEDEHRPLRKDSQLYETFVELARELEGRLPTFCRPASGAPTSAEEALS